MPGLVDTQDKVSLKLSKMGRFVFFSFVFVSFISKVCFGALTTEVKKEISTLVTTSLSSVAHQLKTLDSCSKTQQTLMSVVTGDVSHLTAQMKRYQCFQQNITERCNWVEKMENFTNEIQNLNVTLVTSIRDVTSLVQSTQANCSAEHASLRTQLAVQQQENKNFANQLKHQRTLITDVQNKCKNDTDALVRKNVEQDKRLDKLDALEGKIKQLTINHQQELAKLNSSIGNQQNVINTLQMKNKDQDKEIQNLKVLQTQYTNLQQGIKTLETQLKNVDSGLASQKVTVRQLETLTQSLQSRNQVQDTIIKGLQTGLTNQASKANKEISKLKNLSNTQKNLISSLTNENKGQEAQIQKLAQAIANMNGTLNKMPGERKNCHRRWFWYSLTFTALDFSFFF